jgi:circadian clock protein KaiB
MTFPQNGVAVDTQMRTNANEYTFYLYIKGASPNSIRAITNIKDLLELYFHGKYALKIIDVHQNYVSAKNELLIVLPLIVRLFPLPQRRCTGDMSDSHNVLTALDLLNCL